LHIAFLLVKSYKPEACFRTEGIQLELRFQGPFGVDFDVVLPRCFSYAGDLAFVCEVSEADAADAEVAQVCMRAAADLATVIAAG